jgi:hypothetical protein
MLDEVNILINLAQVWDVWDQACFMTSFIMRWIIDLNTRMEHLTFGYDGQHLWAKHLD